MWKNSSGKIIDLTPKRGNENKVLFIPDPTRTFVLTYYKRYPAIQSYDNVRMQKGKIKNKIENILIALTLEKIYESV